MLLADPMGGVLALRAHCAHTARYFLTRAPPKSHEAHPFQTPLKLGDLNYPSSRQLQATFPSHTTSCTMGPFWHQF